MKAYRIAVAKVSSDSEFLSFIEFIAEAASKGFELMEPVKIQEGYLIANLVKQHGKEF